MRKKLTSHVGEFLASALHIIAVSGLDGVLDGAGSGIINTQDRTLHQLDLSGGIATQAASFGAPNAASASWGLSLAPCLGGRGLTAGVWGGDAAGNAKSGCRALQRLTGVDGWRSRGIVGIVVGSLGSICLGQTVA